MIPRPQISTFYHLLPAALFLLFGLNMLPDFEVMYDDFIESEMIRDSFRLIATYLEHGHVADINRRVAWDHEYYGTFFNLFAYPFVLLFGTDDIISFESIHARQYAIFIFACLGGVALAIGIYRVTASRYSAWLAFGILALMPLYIFYAFNNARDVPFAVMMTISSLVGARGIAALRQSSPQLLQRTQIRWVLWVGLTLGLCASVRTGAVVVYGYWCLALAGCLLWDKTFRLKPWILAVMLVGAIMFLVIWIMHPAAYFQPVEWLITTLTFHRQHPFKGYTLTDGELIYALETPWYFVPKWLFAKMPLLWQWLGAVGILLACARFRTLSSEAQALVILFLLQLLAFPAIAILGGSPLYGDGRHFLFIYPAIAFFSALTIIQILQFPKPYAMVACAGVGLLSVKIVWDMARLHPYQQAYFIEPVRATLPGRWEYWGETQEAARWLSKHTDANHMLINMPWARVGRYVNFYTTRRIKVFNTRQLDKLPAPFYFLDYGDVEIAYPDKRDRCQLIHRITRPLGPVELTLSKIKYCP